MAGLVAVAEGRAADAEPLFMAAIETLAAIPIVHNVADAVDGLAACATARGDQARAARLTELAAGLLDGRAVYVSGGREFLSWDWLLTKPDPKGRVGLVGPAT